MEKLKVEKRNAEFSLKFMFTFKKPILPASNSRFVSWLVQFLSEFLSLNQYFVYFWNVKCRKYATRQSGKTLGAIFKEPYIDILKMRKNAAPKKVKNKNMVKKNNL